MTENFGDRSCWKKDKKKINYFRYNENNKRKVRRNKEI